ncbi:protein of unknown function [Azospirillum lipoferum 4B]|uniref:Uncharacterized protein n=1 Tax=Azospirillum lipoferum (strain 4B) TaxID=862719 RepID=G7Z239_AZOL4|nr:protein of unknown function [Azospirillum lipoferum 4B]
MGRGYPLPAPHPQVPPTAPTLLYLPPNFPHSG